MTSQSPARWLIYALGGGLGHFQRAIALARRAALDGVTVHVLTNSASAVQILTPDCRRLVARDERGLDELNAPDRVTIELLAADLPSDELRRRVHERLHAETWDRLIVDTFPRGLLGELTTELPRLSLPKVLVHRTLNDRYVAWADLRRFVADQFDLVVVPGESASLDDLPSARPTDPWLVVDGHESLTRTAARAALDIAADDDRPLVLVLACGQPQEALAAVEAAVEAAAQFIDKALIRILSHDRHALARAGDLGRCVWPAMVLFSAADGIVGAGGYHTVHEAQAIGTPLWAVAQPRLYDRQALRIPAASRCDDWAAALHRAMHAPRSITQPGTGPDFRSGVHTAIPWLTALDHAGAYR